jgi:succinyl-diaminopimelate desuccinylase
MADENERWFLDTIHARRADLIATAQSLVRENSTNPSGDVSAVAGVAIELIHALIPSAEVSIKQSAPGLTNVVAVIRGSRFGKQLIFSGHLDTYGFGDLAKWTVPPTGGVVSDDGSRLYGRGSADMKGGIAASLVAVGVLASRKDLWTGEIVIILAGDEETMGQLGTSYVLDKIDVAKNAAVICGDAGSPLVIRIGEKGLVWIEVKAEGRSAHGAHVHRGINAINRLLAAVEKVQDLEQTIFPSRPAEVYAAIAAAMPISEPLSGEGESHTLQSLTVNVGSISGGTSMNLVPDSASAAIDIRLPMGITAAEVIQTLHERLDNFEGISFQVLQQYDPSWTPSSEDIARYAIECSNLVTKTTTVVNMRVGASDTRLFRQKGIPSVVVGLTPFNMGGADEYLLINEMLQVAQIHALIALRFLRSP